MNRMDNPLRGEIWRVDFDPTEGSETGKTRPAVVIGDEQLGRLPVRVVIPITGWNESYKGYVWMTRLMPTPQNGLTKPSAADALQIRTVSLLRFQDRVGILPADTVDRIAASVAVCVRAPRV